MSGTYTPSSTGLHELKIYNYRNSPRTALLNYIDDILLVPANPDLTIDPGNMFARMNLGLCLAYSDHLYEAVKEYKKVLELAPDGSKYASTAKKMLEKIKDLI